MANNHDFINLYAIIVHSQIRIHLNHFTYSTACCFEHDLYNYHVWPIFCEPKIPFNSYLFLSILLPSCRQPRVDPFHVYTGFLRVELTLTSKMVKLICSNMHSWSRLSYRSSTHLLLTRNMSYKYHEVCDFYSMHVNHWFK